MSKKIEHEYTKEIVCPHCGWEDTDSWEYGNDWDDDLGLMECRVCGKEFIATRHTEVTYSTEKNRGGN